MTDCEWKFYPQGPLGQLIGQGSTGKVYKYQCPPNAANCPDNAVIKVVNTRTEAEKLKQIETAQFNETITRGTTPETAFIAPLYQVQTCNKTVYDVMAGYDTDLMRYGTKLFNDLVLPRVPGLQAQINREIQAHLIDGCLLIPFAVLQQAFLITKTVYDGYTTPSTTVQHLIHGDTKPDNIFIKILPGGTLKLALADLETSGIYQGTPVPREAWSRNHLKCKYPFTLTPDQAPFINTWQLETAMHFSHATFVLITKPDGTPSIVPFTNSDDYGIPIPAQVRASLAARCPRYNEIIEENKQVISRLNRYIRANIR